MPEQPISLNLARIVHRLVTSPRGWRVSQLQDELEIAPRTYRKYRLLLTEEFRPFLRRDGVSAVIEVVDGAERYLRLRPGVERGPSSPDLVLHAMAVHFAHSLLTSTGDRILAGAARGLLADFRAGLRDREFVLNGILADADRMFVARGPLTGALGRTDHLVRAVAGRRLTLLRGPTINSIVAPLSIVLEPEGVSCVFDRDGTIDAVDLREIEHVEVLDAQFHYPPASRYPGP